MESSRTDRFSIGSIVRSTGYRVLHRPVELAGLIGNLPKPAFEAKSQIPIRGEPNRTSRPEFHTYTSEQSPLRIGSGARVPRTKTASRMRKEKITWLVLSGSSPDSGVRID